jgi:hypothetical protein
MQYDAKSFEMISFTLKEMKALELIPSTYLSVLNIPAENTGSISDLWQNTSIYGFPLRTHASC